MKDGFLTLDAVNTPLGTVLQEIGERADFKVFGHDRLAEPVTWSITDVALDRALRRLTHGVSLVAVHAPSGRLTELRILRSAVDAMGNDLALARAIIKRPGGHTEGAATADLSNDLKDMLETVDRLVAKGDSDAADGLAEMLADDQPPILRMKAAFGLGKIREAPAREALTELLGDSDAMLRRHAVRALGRNWGQQMSERLSRVLTNDTEPTVRRIAAHVLARAGTVAAVEALHAARFDLDSSVRQTATDSLIFLERIGVTLERQYKRRQNHY